MRRRHLPIAIAAMTLACGVAPEAPQGTTAGSDEARAIVEEGSRLMYREPAEAAPLFRRAATLDPSYGLAQYDLAMVAFLLDRPDEARDAISEALESSGLPDPAASVAPALSLFIAGDMDGAAASLDAALDRHPDDPDLHYLAGRIHADSCAHFDPDAVIHHLERVREARPDFLPARRALLEAYEMKGMNEWALSGALAYAASDPEATEAIGELGRVRIAREEYGDAIEIADEIIRRGGDVFAHGLASVFILAGLNEQLHAMYDPEMEHLSSAQANVMTHLHAGISDVWTGRLAKAIEHFERGPEFLPGPWSASRRALFYLILARVQLIQGRVREAIDSLGVARRECGDLPILDYVLGATALQAGSSAEAESALARLGVERRVSAIGWSEPWRLLLAGEIALAAGQVPSALDSFREAWRLQSPLGLDCVTGHVEAYYLDALGRAYVEARRPREALRIYEQIRALGLAGLHQPLIGVLTLYRMGRAHEALGNRAAARARYEEFLELWGDADAEIPEVSEARRRLDRIGG